jgi:hypothetical protein
MIWFITHINNLLLFYSNELSKYCRLFGNSTCSLIYSNIARKRTSSDYFNPPNRTTKSKPEPHHSGINEIKYLWIKGYVDESNLAIVDGNLKEAKTVVRDVETQLLEIEPMPTKFLDNIHKAIKAIASSDIDKALNTLTQLQVTILKAENLIFKAVVANPQMMQQFETMEPNINEEEDSQDIEDTSSEEDSQDIEDT